MGNDLSISKMKMVMIAQVANYSEFDADTSDRQRNNSSVVKFLLRDQSWPSIFAPGADRSERSELNPA